MLDRMLLEKDAHTVITNEVLGRIIVPEARPREACGYCNGTGKVLVVAQTAEGKPMAGLLEGTANACSACNGSGFIWAHWPGLERPLQERFEWWKHKGLAKDPDDRYTYYWAIAKQCRPYLIAEVGVFYGYSLMAMCKGALAGGSGEVVGNGFDNETYTSGCLEWARQGFMEEKISCNLMHQDTQKMDAFPLHMIQLASIDGDHSYESAMHDLLLMEKCMVPRPRQDATYIVDDTGWALNVRAAAEKFAEDFGYDVMHLPTHKGTTVLTRKEEMS